VPHTSGLLVGLSFSLLSGRSLFAAGCPMFASSERGDFVLVMNVEKVCGVPPF
jgi:hypothetical protein